MTTITLPPEIAERIEKAAALRGLDADNDAAALLTASLDAEHEEFKDACRGITAGLADGFAGRSMAWEDYLAEQNAAVDERHKAREAGNG